MNDRVMRDWFEVWIEPVLKTLQKGSHNQRICIAQVWIMFFLTIFIFYSILFNINAMIKKIKYVVLNCSVGKYTHIIYFKSVIVT